MASITFGSGTTIPSVWLNDVNNLVWGVFSGATTPALARTALGLGSMALQNSNNVSITGGSITGITITIGANTITTAMIQDAAVTYAKIQNVSTNARVLGRSTAGAGPIEELSLGAGLSIAAGVLNTVGGAASGPPFLYTQYFPTF